MVLRGPTVRNDGTSDAILVKHAIGAERLRLHHEAQVLAAARMDGVVECAGLEDFDQRTELRLRYMEAATLAELPPLRPCDALDMLISLGAILAELHARGIRHGALRSDHVLVAPPSSPVLCGFGEATGPDDRTQHLASTDVSALAALGIAELARAYDTAADDDSHRCAAALLACEQLAASADGAHDPHEPLTAWRARLEQLRDADAAVQAGIAPGFGAAQPPTASFAHDPHGLRQRLRADDAEAPEREAEAGDAEAARRSHPPLAGRRRLAASAAAASVLVLASLLGLRSLADSGSPRGGPEEMMRIAAAPSATPAPFPAAASGSAGARPAAGSADGAGADGSDGNSALASAVPVGDAEVPPTVAPESATLLYGTSSTRCTAPTTGSDGADGEPTAADVTREVYRSDVSGDGCPEPVYVEAPADGSAPATVRTADGEWTIGAAGDLVAVGDWDCDGRATPAVVSPAAGVASFFAVWPRSRHAVMPTRVAHVPRHASAVSVISAAAASAPHAAAGSDALAGETATTACDELVVGYDELRLTLSASAPAAGTAPQLAAKHSQEAEPIGEAVARAAREPERTRAGNNS